MKSKRFFCLLTCLLLLLQTGCTTELYDRLLIHAIGVDHSDNGFKVTVRVARTGEEEKEEIFFGEGESVYLALDSIKLKTGKTPLYSHNYLVIFGRECCEEGLDAALNFFTRHFESRPSVKIFMAENTAEEVLSVTQNDELIASDAIENMVNKDVSGGDAVEMEVIDFLNDWAKPGAASCLPILTANENVVELSDTGVFLDGKLKTTLSAYETGGFLAITGQLTGATYALQNEDGTQISLRVGDMSAKLVADTANPQALTVQISLEADIAAYDGTKSNGQTDGPDNEELSVALAQVIYCQAQAAIQQALEENGCDIFGFATRLCAGNTALRAVLQENPAAAADFEIHLDVQAKVNHVGGELTPYL